MFISFIIPVYNAANYIKRCINSIITQEFSDYEIIIVNDGSTDNSDTVIKELITSRVKYVSKENGGVSSARNIGMEKAKGEWLWFVDADDYLLEGAKEVVENALSEDCQAIALSYLQETNTGHSYPFLATQELHAGVYSGLLLLNTKTCSPTVWSFLFRSDLIKKYGLRMEESLKYGEDRIFIMEYLTHVDKILLSEMPVYKYVFCETSAVHNNDKKNEREIDDQLESIIYLLHYSKEQGIPYSIYDAPIFYIVTQFLLLCFNGKIGTSVCKIKYKRFLKQLSTAGYKNLLLILIKIGLPLFYRKPYLLKRRFMFWYFNRQRRKLCLV